jgi:hypothetical protein
VHLSEELIAAAFDGLGSCQPVLDLVLGNWHLRIVRPLRIGIALLENKLGCVAALALTFGCACHSHTVAE